MSIELQAVLAIPLLYLTIIICSVLFGFIRFLAEILEICVESAQEVVENRFPRFYKVVYAVFSIVALPILFVVLSLFFFRYLR